MTPDTMDYVCECIFVAAFAIMLIFRQSALSIFVVIKDVFSSTTPFLLNINFAMTLGLFVLQSLLKEIGHGKYKNTMYLWYKLYWMNIMWCLDVSQAL